MMKNKIEKIEKKYKTNKGFTIVASVIIGLFFATLALIDLQFAFVMIVCTIIWGIGLVVTTYSYMELQLEERKVTKNAVKGRKKN